MHICPKCGGEKTPICSKAGKNGSGYRCRPCWAAYMREFNKRPEHAAKRKTRDRLRYERTKPARREWELAYRFGITQAEYDAMLADQGGACAICRGPQVGRAKALDVDHCHASGAIRGLLCTNCNNALGRAKDDPARLRAMADYIERSRNPKLRVVA